MFRVGEGTQIKLAGNRINLYFDKKEVPMLYVTRSLSHYLNRYHRKISRCLTIIVVGFIFFSTSGATLNAEEKFMIIIIDGARYTETFGDPNHEYIPNMWNLRTEGTYLTQFYNDSITYTSRAIPALWAGTWTEVRDTLYNGHNTSYSVKPTIFEYFRAQKNAPPEDCFYVLKFINNLWLPSFHPDYGPSTWPQFHSVGFSDAEVATEAQWVLNTSHPRFIWVYLADVDNAGHSGVWSNYVNAIQKADSIVGVLWNTLQNDPFYQDSTYLFVTNDHGRHDDLHGGFSGHGDGCEGCRHIMFLALGPDIKAGFQSSQYRRIPDMAVSAAFLLGLDPEYATGEPISEMIQTTSLEDKESTKLKKFSLSQ
ncbi:MAG: hypothetical protein D6732_04430, partial [Methanobacteriota archaeon]